MNVRYFAAARAAAGAEEEQFHLPEGTTLEGVVAAIVAVERAEPPAGTPPLPRILSRSSFLLNGVAARNPAVVVGPGDTVDVLPPFAGG